MIGSRGRSKPEQSDFRRIQLIRLLLPILPALAASAAHAARECQDWWADVISAEGAVEVQREGEAAWRNVALGDVVCRGDSIHVGRYGRAALKLPDDTVLRVDANSSLTFAQPQDETGSWVDLVKGIIHVISRDPRSLRFTTPYVNAGLEGTEFVIAVGAEQTDVTVLEGEVLLRNEAGTLGVPGGERGSARARVAPVSAAVERPLDAARWTLYYAPILALPQLDPAEEPTSSQGDPAFYVARASRRLATGQVDDASADLARARRLDPGSASSLALESIIALTQHRRAEALDLARRAVAEDPVGTAGLIALSHAQQAHVDLAGARSSLETATLHDPRSAIAWSRLAEIRLATGDVPGAVAAAQTAVSLDPGLGHAFSMLGFAQLSLMAPAEAARSFERAISADQANPLPRLGLGLALMRERRPIEGREQMEIAVLLDPGNALARSYMAKAYYDEHRPALSQSQLELAKEFDPLDPTPWLYGALRKQSANRPVEALEDWRQAAARNANRPVFRSRLLIDEDLAARSAGLGRLHRDLGFEQLALIQGWRSAIADPGDYSGHRLLADVYSTLPRHEIARVNELYQSQLLQPINLTPIPPQLAEANLFILDTAGPIDLAFSEFTPLLEGNGLRFQGSAVVADRGTAGENAILAGLHDRLSYSVGYFGFRTDGFRANNDLDQRVANAFLQFRPSHDTSIQGELRTSRTDKGDLQLLFDRTIFDPSLRQRENVDSARLGLRRELSERSTLLASFVYESTALTSVGGETFFLETDRAGHGVDLQHIHRRHAWNVVSGVRYFGQDARDSGTVSVFSPEPPFVIQTTASTRLDLRHSSAYGYANVMLREGLAATIGASADWVRVPFLGSRNRLNPKLGLTWEPTPFTTLRAGTFRTLQGPLVSRHNVQPRLEPTHVAGFNQFFFGNSGDDAWRYAVAVDHQIGERSFAGAEASSRRLETPIAVVEPSSPVPLLKWGDVEERAYRTYFYWAPLTSMSVSTEYQYESFDNSGFVLANGFARMKTHRLPLEINYFHGSGFNGGLRATRVAQRGDFIEPLEAPASPMQEMAPFDPNATVPGSDRFWVVDLSLGYRLPRRLGLLSLNIHNLLDTDFRFQDTVPENPRILPERMLSFRFTVAY